MRSATFGAWLYFYCVGCCPFLAGPGEKPTETVYLAMRDAVGFKVEDWAWADADLMTLIQDMLTKRPRQRPSAEELATKYAKLLDPKDILQNVL